MLCRTTFLPRRSCSLPVTPAHGRICPGYEYPWEILAEIKDIIREVGATLPPDEYNHPAEDIGSPGSARIAPTAYIGAPAIIGADTEVRHGAFIRGAALVGDGCGRQLGGVEELHPV